MKSRCSGCRCRPRFSCEASVFLPFSVHPPLGKAKRFVLTVYSNARTHCTWLPSADLAPFFTLVGDGNVEKQIIFYHSPRVGCTRVHCDARASTDLSALCFRRWKNLSLFRFFRKARVRSEKLKVILVEAFDVTLGDSPRVCPRGLSCGTSESTQRKFMRVLRHLHFSLGCLEEIEMCIVTNFGESAFFKGSSMAPTIPVTSASSASFIQIMKPKLPRKITRSPKINLNKYWNLFENVMSPECEGNSSSTRIKKRNELEDAEMDNEINENICNEEREVNDNLTRRNNERNTLGGSCTCHFCLITDMRNVTLSGRNEEITEL